MKKNLLLSIPPILLVLGLGLFSMQYLPGLKPLLENPPYDIASILETQQSQEAPLPNPGNQYPGDPINKTEFPLNLPKGFTISVFAKNLGTPRVLTTDPNGNLVTSLIKEGKVVLLPDMNKDGKADETKVLIDKLHQPHGLAFNCEGDNCQIFVAETEKVSAYTYNKDTSKAENPKKLFDLPNNGGHYSRTLLIINQDGQKKLLTSVGSSCNVCNETDELRAKVLISNLDGSDLKDYSRGLRNAVFMKTHPVTGEVWVTEMGRDLLGDNIPPEEVNILKEGANFGWPICYGDKVHDSNFDKNQYIRNPCEDTIAPHIKMQAHSAPLGLAFIPKEGWPAEYADDILVVFHGSWNRKEPTGYMIVRFPLDEDGKIEGEQQDFINGWLTKDNKASGRPVDILVQPGGIAYISDDKAGVVYKLSYI